MTEAEKNFEEWARRSGILCSEYDTNVAKSGFMAGWDIALQDVVEPPEPTPTEMVKALLEKGWKVDKLLFDDVWKLGFRPPEETNDDGSCSFEYAYRKAFPRKKKVTVDAWISKMNGSIITLIPSKPRDWTKGQFTYEEEE